MTNHVRTQSITNGQIGQINDRLATKLREAGLLCEGVQGVLQMTGNAVIDEMVAVFRKHVEAQGDIIVRRVRVDRTRTLQEVIVAIDRVSYVDEDVLATMPQGSGDEVDVYFVPTKRYVPAAEVPAFLAQHGLVPDPRAQASVNEADKAFADQYPNATSWGDNICLSFNRHRLRGRIVRCSRDERGWTSDWFLSGVPGPCK